jgi:hypothetical protein
MKMNELRQNSRSVNRSHLINGKVSRFVNLYLLNFDSGAESGVVFPAQGNALGFGIERAPLPRHRGKFSNGGICRMGI